MEQLIISILMASLYGTLVGGIILLIKKLFRYKLSPTWQYAIWIVLLIKLIVPIGPASRLSVFNMIPIHSASSYVSDSSRGMVTEIEQGKVGGNLQSLGSDEGVANPKNSLLTYVGWLWLVGVLAMGTGLAISYTRLIGRMRRCRKITDPNVLRVLERCKVELGVLGYIELILQEEVKSPALIGFFRPCILLTSESLTLGEQQLAYIMSHELTHLKRRDSMANVVIVIVQTLHWFNPAIWYFAKKVREDMEIATDASVLSGIAYGEHLAYGQTLLTILEGANEKRHIPQLLGVADDKKTMAYRIQSIKKMAGNKRPKRWMMGLGIGIILGLGIVLLTSGKVPLQEASHVERLFKYRTPYVGDNSKVIGLIDQLSYAEYRGDVQLSTSEEPYEIDINYDFRDSKLTMPMIRSYLEENAELLFALIKNVEFIRFNIINLVDEEYPYKLCYENNGVSYVESEEELENLIKSPYTRVISNNILGASVWYSGSALEEKDLETIKGEITSIFEGDNGYGVNVINEGRVFGFSIAKIEFEKSNARIGDKIEFNGSKDPSIMVVNP